MSGTAYGGVELEMGFEPTNLLITNQLLYRLSYPSVGLRGCALFYDLAKASQCNANYTR